MTPIELRLSRSLVLGILAVLLVRQAPAQQPPVLPKVSPSVSCRISVDQVKWVSAADTTIHVQLLPASGYQTTLDVAPVLRLYAPAQKTWEQPKSYWAPADLNTDAPAAIKNRSGSITRRPQVLVVKSPSTEFTLHASNLKWDKEISSIWPSFGLFGTVLPGEYRLEFSIGSVAVGKCNPVVITLAPKSS